MLKNTIYMALTTGIKMLSGILVFVIMARVLGPHDFGMIAYSFTLASLFVLIVDYGFSQQLLRDIGANPENVNVIIGRVFVAKLILSLATLLISVFYLELFPKDNKTETVYWLLLSSSILASFCEFLNTAFRGTGQYRKETNIAIAGSLIHFLMLLAVLITVPDVLLVAATFICSRLIFLVVSWYAYMNHIGKIILPSRINPLLSGLRTGFPYAIDAAFTNFIYQIDTIMVNHYLGLPGVGLYQAATKWLQGAMQFAPVLSNVYLPTLSATSMNKDTNRMHAKHLNMQMLVIGFSGWLFFNFAGEYFTEIIYGDRYKDLNDIWPYVGLLMFIRYLAGAQGVLLAAQGKQRIRVFAQIAALILLFISAPYLLSNYRQAGMLIALSLAIFLLFSIFIYALLKNRIPTGFDYKSSVFTFLVLTISIVLIAK